MFLYKLELEIEGKLTLFVVPAESDEKAFSYIESHLAHHFIKMPEVKSAAIVEKKRLNPGAGYVIETNITV